MRWEQIWPAVVAGFAGAALWPIFWRLLAGMLMVGIYLVAIPAFYWTTWRGDGEAKLKVLKRLFCPANELRRNIFRPNW